MNAVNAQYQFSIEGSNILLSTTLKDTVINKKNKVIFEIEINNFDSTSLLTQFEEYNGAIVPVIRIDETFRLNREISFYIGDCRSNYYYRDHQCDSVQFNKLMPKEIVKTRYIVELNNCASYYVNNFQINFKLKFIRPIANTFNNIMSVINFDGYSKLSQSISLKVNRQFRYSEMILDQ